MRATLLKKGKKMKITDEISIPTTEIEADGFITRQDDLEYTQNIFSVARLSKECIYPKCEECGYYRQYYCTVPMVVSKQIYHQTAERMAKIEKYLIELEKLVTEEILGSDLEYYK